MQLRQIHARTFTDRHILLACSIGVTKMPLRIFKHVDMASSHAVEKLEKFSGIHVHVRIVRGSRVFLD